MKDIDIRWRGYPHHVPKIHLCRRRKLSVATSPIPAIDGAGSSKGRPKPSSTLKPVADIPVYWSAGTRISSFNPDRLSISSAREPHESYPVTRIDQVQEPYSIHRPRTIERNYDSRIVPKFANKYSRPIKSPSTQLGPFKPNVTKYKDNRTGRTSMKSSRQSLRSIGHLSSSKSRSRRSVAPSIQSVIKSVLSETPSRTPSQRKALDQFVRELASYTQKSQRAHKHALPPSRSITTISANTIQELEPYRAQFASAGLAVTSSEQRGLVKSAKTSIRIIPGRNDETYKKITGTRVKTSVPLSKGNNRVAVPRRRKEPSFGSGSTGTTVIGFTPPHEKSLARAHRPRKASSISSNHTIVGFTPPHERYAPTPAPPSTHDLIGVPRPHERDTRQLGSLTSDYRTVVSSQKRISPQPATLQSDEDRVGGVERRDGHSQQPLVLPTAHSGFLPLQERLPQEFSTLQNDRITFLDPRRISIDHSNVGYSRLVGESIPQPSLPNNNLTIGREYSRGNFTREPPSPPSRDTLVTYQPRTRSAKEPDYLLEKPESMKEPTNHEEPYSFRSKDNIVKFEHRGETLVPQPRSSPAKYNVVESVGHKEVLTQELGSIPSQYDTVRLVRHPKRDAPEANVNADMYNALMVDQGILGQSSNPLLGVNPTPRPHPQKKHIAESPTQRQGPKKALPWLRKPVTSVDTYPVKAYWDKQQTSNVLIDCVLEGGFQKVNFDTGNSPQQESIQGPMQTRWDTQSVMADSGLEDQRQKTYSYGTVRSRRTIQKKQNIPNSIVNSGLMDESKTEGPSTGDAQGKGLLQSTTKPPRNIYNVTTDSQHRDGRPRVYPFAGDTYRTGSSQLTPELRASSLIGKDRSRMKWSREDLELSTNNKSSSEAMVADVSRLSSDTIALTPTREHQTQIGRLRSNNIAEGNRIHEQMRETTISWGTPPFPSHSGVAKVLNDLPLVESTCEFIDSNSNGYLLQDATPVVNNQGTFSPLPFYTQIEDDQCEMKATRKPISMNTSCANNKAPNFITLGVVKSPQLPTTLVRIAEDRPQVGIVAKVKNVGSRLPEPTDLTAALPLTPAQDTGRAPGERSKLKWTRDAAITNTISQKQFTMTSGLLSPPSSPLRFDQHPSTSTPSRVAMVGDESLVESLPMMGSNQNTPQVVHLQHTCSRQSLRCQQCYPSGSVSPEVLPIEATLSLEEVAACQRQITDTIAQAIVTAEFSSRPGVLRDTEQRRPVVESTQDFSNLSPIADPVKRPSLPQIFDNDSPTTQRQAFRNQGIKTPDAPPASKSSRRNFRQDQRMNIAPPVLANIAMSNLPDGTEPPLLMPLPSISNSLDSVEETTSYDRRVFQGLHVATAAASDEEIDKWIQEVTGISIRKFLVELSVFEGLGVNTLANVAKRASKHRQGQIRAWEAVREKRMSELGKSMEK